MDNVIKRHFELEVCCHLTIELIETFQTENERHTAHGFRSMSDYILVKFSSPFFPANKSLEYIIRLRSSQKLATFVTTNM